MSPTQHYAATTLDGVIASPESSLDWRNGDFACARYTAREVGPGR